MLANARHFVLIVLSVSFLVPFAALAVEVLSILPSDRFTVFDNTQITLRRVNLPTPADCASTPAKVLQCQDVSVLNTLDGFNIQPRISVRFSGAIDVTTVNSDSVFLVKLGDMRGLGTFGAKVGINQIVWDPATNSLHVESDELLEQHTRYAVVVTSRVHDTGGNPVQSVHASRHAADDDDDDKIARSASRHGVPVVAASVFTTLSVTATLERVHRDINSSWPERANFNLGAAGERTVFPLASILPPGSVLFNRQNSVSGPLSSNAIAAIPALAAVPGVGSVAFGSYVSPSYLLTPGEFIPPTGTRTGRPEPQRLDTLYFNLVLPRGTPPATGWPVAIFGHGFGDNKNNSPFVVAASMAAQGIATIAINVVGHGGGPLGTLTVNRAGSLPPVVLPAGGRGIDQNGSGTIDATEGSSAASPRILIGSSDALRQTTIDLMQLVRTIQAGMDVDGDGAPDLDGNRIYYFGQSFGGIYGTIFLGVERDVQVGVPNVPGGAIIDIVRLSPVFRGLFVQAALARGLANAPAPAFANENLPLRDQSPLVNNVLGAMALQEYTEHAEWASQVGNPVAYAPYIRKSPLPGNPAKSVIYQIAKGDQTVPNPTSTAIIRAGELQDRVTYYRNDLAGTGRVANPHTFLTNIGGAAALNAFAAQAQIATFFMSHGALTNDPDAGAPVFETPIAGPLPEERNF
jgi:hypothetical protein